MNCQSFQNELFEYVEGTLSTNTMAAAEKHLAECDACRDAVEKEKRRALALSSRLHQVGQPLTLRPEIRRNILAASGQKCSAPTVAGSLIDVCKYWLRCAAIPVTMLLVAGFLLTFYFSGIKSRRTVLAPVTPRLSSTTSLTRNNPGTLVSVEMSCRLPVHEFHQEENVVLDAFVDETVVVNQVIPSSSLKNLPRKLEFKTPL